MFETTSLSQFAARVTLIGRDPSWVHQRPRVVEATNGNANKRPTTIRPHRKEEPPPTVENLRSMQCNRHLGHETPGKQQRGVFVTSQKLQNPNCETDIEHREDAIRHTAKPLKIHATQVTRLRASNVVANLCTRIPLRSCPTKVVDLCKSCSMAQP